ncbi:MAG: nucleotidyltransferase family protein [Dehalococcoidia bacterium]
MVGLWTGCTQVHVRSEDIGRFCRKHHIRRLALFGSVMREDFGPESDIDVLAEFIPGHVPGLIRLAGMEMELAELFPGRKVDMNTPNLLSPHFRESAMAEAQDLYVAA